MDNNPDHFIWAEKYRPTKVEDCILPDNILNPFKSFVTKKEIPTMLLAGGPGVGKTTVAKALCNEVGCDFMVINGSDERGIDVLRSKIKNYASSVSFSGGRKVVIIDEADNMTEELQKGLRSAIEEFAANCSFIFTCNFKARILPALHSRCGGAIDFKISPADKAKMAGTFLKRLKAILDEENIKYDVQVLVPLIQKHFPDFRAIINECQRHAGSGIIDVDILTSFDIKLKDLVKLLKAKDFGSMRKWVSATSIDPTTLYRELYNTMYTYVKPESIPALVLLLADYQFKGAMAADLEINTVACLTEIMGNVEFQ